MSTPPEQPNRLSVLVGELIWLAGIKGDNLKETRDQKLKAKAAEIFQLGRSIGWDERSALADLQEEKPRTVKRMVGRKVVEQPVPGTGMPTDGRPVRPEAANRMLHRNPSRPPGF